tara:strand:+ start:1115 stop:1378 length:264 start_codon:yes stop_codon:yes gene_type:complete
MIKELKYLFFVVTIFVFIFLTLKYYFSDVNKKNSYRSLNQNPKKIIDYSKKLILLKDNTDNIVEYVEKAINKNKKDYNFWKLIYNDE